MTSIFSICVHREEHQEGKQAGARLAGQVSISLQVLHGKYYKHLTPK